MACFYDHLLAHIRSLKTIIAVLVGLIAVGASPAQAQLCTTTLSVTGGSCNTVTNMHSLTGVFTADNVATPPLTVTVTAGTTSVVQSLTANNNTFTFSIGSLPSDGQVKTVTVATSSTECSAVSQTYTAPSSCTVALPCSLSLALNSSDCNTSSNAYSLTGILTATNITSPLTVTVTGAGFTPIVQSLTALNTTFSFLVNDLPADGLLKTITITSSATACGSISQTYTAPEACSVAQPCSVSLTVTPTACNSATNSFTLVGVANVTNGPSTGVLTISTAGASLTYAVTSSAGNYSFTIGLPSTGTGTIGTITASFSETACGPVSQTYLAPGACFVAPPCSVSLVLTPSLCSTLTNTYSLTGIVVTANSSPPSTVTITGAGITPIVQSLTAVNNILVFTIPGFNSDGLTKTLTATFSGSTCSVVSSTYTAPTACTQTQQQPCSVSLALAPTACNPATNNFTLNGAVNIANGPTSGSLTVTSGSLSITFPISPTIGTYNFAMNNLPSTGAIGTVTVTFSGTSCGPVSLTYAAPLSCTQTQQQPCSLSLTLSPGICSTATNNYSLSGVLVANNSTPPLTITVTGAGFLPIVQSLTAVNNTVNLTINNLSSDGQVKTITVNTSATACSTISETYTAPASCTSTTVVCSQIALTRLSNNSICNGQCASFSINTTATGVIQLVWFTTPQSGTAAYAGGTVIDEGTPTNGVLIIPQGIPGLSLPSNTGTAPVTYYIYAILKNPSADPGCRPVAETQVTVLPSPQFSLTSLPVCASSPTRSVLINIGSTGTFNVVFAESIGAVSCGLAAPFGVVTSLTITGGTTATALIPASFTGVVLIANQTTGCQAFGAVGSATLLASPTFSVAATPVSCSGIITNTDGAVTISNLSNGVTYQYSTGSTFNSGTAIPNTPQAIPGNGIIAGNLSNPATVQGQTYTVRVVGPGGCSTDQMVTLPFRDCTCPPTKCVPIIAEKIR